MGYYGGVLIGWQSARVRVNCRASPAEGRATLSLIGNVGHVLREIRAIIPHAFESQDLPVPTGRISVQLQPVDLPKNRAALHLPIALAIFAEFLRSGEGEVRHVAELGSQEAGSLDSELAEAEQERQDAEAAIEWAERMADSRSRRYYCFGEINIHGEVHRVSGALSLLDQARPGDVVMVPEANLHEAQFWARTSTSHGIELYAVPDLRAAIEVLASSGEAYSVRSRPLPRFNKHRGLGDVDMSQIVGQEAAKRALEIAAAGGHHCLLYGPQGEGKTLLARALPGILPTLDPSVNMDEIQEINRIWSAKGKLADGELVLQRPFRDVHPGITEPALLGGGSGDPQPGEVSLAHRGVLLMDEFPQFAPRLLEKLRGPLQDKQVVVTRVAGSVTYPAAFILVAAMNPCRCSYYGEYECAACRKVIPQDAVACKCGGTSLVHRCGCGSRARTRFEQLLSGPLEDRIHLKVRVYSCETPFSFRRVGESSAKKRARVERARRVQAARFADRDETLNGEVKTPDEIHELFRLTRSAYVLAKRLRDSDILPYRVSMRTLVQTLCVARTIADLAESEELTALHVAEAALRYTRPLLAKIEDRRLLPLSEQQLLDRAQIHSP